MLTPAERSFLEQAVTTPLTVDWGKHRTLLVSLKSRGYLHMVTMDTVQVTEAGGFVLEVLGKTCDAYWYGDSLFGKKESIETPSGWCLLPLHHEGDHEFPNSNMRKQR